MPQTRACDYCGADVEPGTGTMFVATDGTVTHFCSGKCEKNADLGREPRDLEWTEAGGVAELVLGLHEDDLDALLRRELREVHDNLLGGDVLGDEHEVGVAALDGLRRLVGAFLHAAGVASDLEGFEGSLLEVCWDVVVYVYWHCVHLFPRTGLRSGPRRDIRAAPEHHRPPQAVSQHSVTLP